MTRSVHARYASGQTSIASITMQKRQLVRQKGDGHKPHPVNRLVLTPKRLATSSTLLEETQAHCHVMRIRQSLH